MIRSILGHLVLLAAAFLLGIALFLPYELLAERLIFDRIRKETGIEVTARRIAPGWTGDVRAEDVLVRLRWKNELIELPLPSITARVDLLSLLGTRTGGLEINLADGTVDLRLEPSQVVVRADRIDLARFEPLATITGWKISGIVEMTATLNRNTAIPSMNGEVRLRAKNVTADSVTFLGLALSEVRLTNLDAEVAIENGRAILRKAGATGGNLDFTAEGSIGLTTPLAASTLDLLMKFRPGPPIESAVGQNALKMMVKPDGALHLGLGGTLGSPAIAFR